MTTSSEAAPAVPEPAVVVPKAGHACANCGAPMHGPYCYACGQPEKGLIRQLTSVMSDVLDTVFNIDSRVFRSLFPLYFRPGFLTVEYFAGRRVRYVTPFRLFFFLCLLAIFAIQIALDINNTNFNLAGDMDSISSAKNAADVDARMQAAIGGLETAKAAKNMPPAVIGSLQKSIDAIHKQGEERLAFLKARDAAIAKGEKPPADPSEDDGDLMFDGKPWDPKSHPIQLSWLPAFANARLNEMAGRAKDNIIAAKRNPRHLIEAVFSRLPWTLGLLMPMFAVLLKVFYIFKRRLYMEHLMVALHSHAFIFMSLLLLALISLLRSWTMSFAPDLDPAYNILRAAIWIWLPVYLFLMQKRVYRQGWFFTTLKFSMIGIFYTVIVSIGLVGALLATLALE